MVRTKDPQRQAGYVGRSVTPDGCTIAEAFERIDRSLWNTWQSGSEDLARSYFDSLSLVNDGVDGCWLSTMDRSAVEQRVAHGDAALEALRLLRARFLEVAAQFKVTARVGSPTAPSQIIDPVALRYLDLCADLDTSIAEAPNHERLYDVRIFLTDSPSSGKAGVDCEKWLHGLAKDSPEKSPHGTKDGTFSVALGRFPGLSRRSFDAGWSNAAKQPNVKWANPGRPRKSPH